MSRELTKKKLGEEENKDKEYSKSVARAVEFDHPDLHTGKTTREQKVTAAVAYLLGNSTNRSGKIAGVSKATIFDWKLRSRWWPELLAYLKRHHDEDLEARTSGILNRALDNVEDRLLNGDEVVDSKNDKVVRKKVGARDAAIVFGTLYDKRQLMRSQPTSISESISERERLEKLQRQFEELAETKVNALEGEYTEVTVDDNRDG